MKRALGLVLVTAAVAGCGAGAGAVHGITPDAALPSETLADWVSYGDQLSVIAVTDETPPRLPTEWKSSGGLIGRSVTVRIESAPWHRPKAPAISAPFRMQAWGWMMEDDQHADSKIHPLIVQNAPRLQPGGRYLAMLVRLRGDWTPLTDTAVMTLDGDRVTSEVDAGTASGPAATLKGKTVAEAAAIVARAKPYPEAAAHPKAPPVRRFRLVARERG